MTEAGFNFQRWLFLSELRINLNIFFSFFVVLSILLYADKIFYRITSIYSLFELIVKVSVLSESELRHGRTTL